MFSFISLVATVLALNAHPVKAISSEFLTNYCEHRSLRRVTMFSGGDDGAFGKMKKLVSAASARSIQMNVLPFDEFVQSPFTAVIYDNSTEVDRLLIEASSGNFFRANYKWLFLTTPAFHQLLLNSLVNSELGVDSDVTIGIAHSDATVKLFDIYMLGKEIHEDTIGEWSGDVLTLQTPCQRSNFNGFHLKVVTVNVNAFYTVATVNSTDNTVTISGGYFGEVFNLLSEALNFTYSVSVLDGYAYGVISSFSDGLPVWTGVVGELQSRRADVTACEVSLLPERELVMDYSWPLQIISRRLYIQRPKREDSGEGSRSESTWYKGGGFVRPFAMHVWLCVTASLLLFLAASRLHARFTSSPPTLSSDFFGFMATLVQQGPPDEEGESTQSRRLILWTASVTYLIVYTSYGAKLASILANESEPQPPFVDLDGLLMMSNWKLGFIDIGLGRVSFESAGPESVMGRLWSKRVDQSALVPDIVTGLKKALQGHYAFLGFHTGVQALLVQSLSKSKDATFTTSEVCRLLALPNDYLKGGIAFGFQEQSPIRRIFNSWILAMRSCGVLDRLARTWLPEALPCAEEPSVASVALIDIAPALSALALGTTLAATILLLEIIYNFHGIDRNKIAFSH